MDPNISHPQRKVKLWAQNYTNIGYIHVLQCMVNHEVYLHRKGDTICHTHYAESSPLFAGKENPYYDRDLQHTDCQSLQQGCAAGSASGWCKIPCDDDNTVLGTDCASDVATTATGIYCNAGYDDATTTGTGRGSVDDVTGRGEVDDVTTLAAERVKTMTLLEHAKPSGT